MGIALLPFVILLFSVFDSKLIRSLLFLLLILISGFRHFDVGTDTENYRFLFNLFVNGENYKIEPLWVFLNKFVIFLGGDFRSLLVFVSILTFIPIYFLSNRINANGVLVIFFYVTLYYYFYSLNIMRQCLAASLLLIGVYYLLEGRKMFFIGITLIATFFHTSAFVVLVYLFLHLLPNKLWLYIVLIVASASFGLILFEKFFLLFIQSGFYARYESYDLTFGNFSGNLIYLIILNSFFFFIYSISKEKDLIFKMFFLYIFLANLVVRIPFADRIILYFSIIQILFFPLIIKENKLQNKSLIYIVLILYSLVLFARQFGNGEILPYKNILF